MDHSLLNSLEWLAGTVEFADLRLVLVAATVDEWLAWALNLIKVVVGVGLVIFVHELGHFVVAKWNGVRCDKFYLGFDIYGLKLASFRWGETEYGIGALPLGGYVKMLGQEDNPAEMQKELEQARQQQATASESDDEDLAAEAPKLNPRNYQAKSVLQRMSIISAGVIMNVIFAFLLFFVVALVGMNVQPSHVGQVSPGSPAWEAGLRPGDQIVEIGGQENPRFTRDLMRVVMLSDYGEEGIPVTIRRPGEEELIDLRLVPPQNGDRKIIGISPTSTLTLRAEQPVVPQSAADLAGSFKPGDQIVSIDGQPIDAYGPFAITMAERAAEPIQVTVQREVDGQTKEINVTLQPQPLRRLGLRMAMGTVAAIRPDSPAAKAGVKQDDLILGYQDQSGYHENPDPLTLPNVMQNLAGQEIKLRLQRTGEKDPITATIVPESKPAWLNPTIPGGRIVELAPLGLSYRVLDSVAGIVDEIPDSKARNKLQEVGKKLSGRTIVKARMLTAAQKRGEEHPLIKDKPMPIGEGPKVVSWPAYFATYFQLLGPDDSVELTLDDDTTVTLPVYHSEQFYFSDRGLRFETLYQLRQTDDPGQALTWAWEETGHAVTEPLRVIRGMIKGDVGTGIVGGPIKIFAAGSIFAEQGWGDLLMFLGILSANLAVINFLPIPILDGGHMMFLLYEAGRGKPASEKVQVSLQFVGLFLILSLMIFVFYQDSVWLWEWSSS